MTKNSGAPSPPLDRGYAKIQYGISNCGLEQARGGSPLEQARGGSPLITAFDGEENSSKIICEKLSTDCKKIILPNDKAISCEMLKNAVDSGEFNYVFSLGQKSVIKNKITVEDTAKRGEKVLKVNAEPICELINRFGYDCRISHNAGTSFCNNLYFFGLNYISENRLDTEMFFLHVPFVKNCDTDKIADVIDLLIQKLL